MMRKSTLNRNRSQRAGAILAMVIVTLMIVLLLGASLIRTVLVHQQRQRTVEQRRQAEWIAEAAFEKASRSLDQASDYRGETWPLRTSERQQGNSVKITAQAIGGRAGEFRVQVEWDPRQDSPAHSIYRYERIVVRSDGAKPADTQTPTNTSNDSNRENS